MKSAKPAICIVSELPPPPGGMAVQAKLLGESLRAEGHAVYHAPTNALSHDSPWRRFRGLRGLVNFALFLARLWPACRQADCVHVFSNSYLSFFLFTFPAVAAGRALGRRVVLHYHGGSAEPFLARWYWLARWALGRAHVVAVPSGFLAAVFRRFDIDAVEVPNILRLSGLRFRDRVPLRPRVVMARHLEPDYNVGCGIRAFAALGETFGPGTLVIAGDGSERAALAALTKTLGVEGRVRFTGNVVNEAMGLLYDEADIFLNSSRVDNQPVSILEAFACGLPVVTTAVGGIPHLVTEGVDGLMAPDDDSTRLAARMRELLSDAELARRIVAQARQRIDTHEWSRIYDLYRTIYQVPT